MQSPNHTHQGTRTGDDPRVNFQNNLAFISLLLKGDHETAAERLRDGVVEPLEFGAIPASASIAVICLLFTRRLTRTEMAAAGMGRRA